MRKVALGLATILLGACADKAAEAEKRLAMVKQVGSLEEVCEASRKVADAYLEQGEQRKYEMAHVEMGLSCNEVRLDRLRP